MSYRILIMGLPGAGKTTLALNLLNYFNPDVLWLNADEIRRKFDDWDFSERGRIRQSTRMREIANASNRDYIIADFVCQLNEMRDIWEHAQLKARARWAEVASPVGALPALLPPGVPNTWTARMDAIPELGQHTQSILSELGYDDARINQLKSEKAI
jgi:adenylate kinase